MATVEPPNSIYTEEQVITLSHVLHFLRRHHGTIFVDLDDTVFNTCTRSFLIFVEWLQGFVRPDDPMSHIRVNQVQRLTMATHRLLASGCWPYLMGDAFDQIFASAKMKRSDLYGLREDFLDEWWKPRFFGNHYLFADQPNPHASSLQMVLGSPEFADQIRICFLTGRHLPDTNPTVPFRLGMRWGTEQALAAHGLGDCEVVYKDHWGISDGVFKHEFFECEFNRRRRIALRRPRVFVDNEPMYVNAFLGVAEQHDQLGEVMGVLYDGTGVRDPNRIVALRPEARVLRTFNPVSTNWGRPRHARKTK